MGELSLIHYLVVCEVVIAECMIKSQNTIGGAIIFAKPRVCSRFTELHSYCACLIIIWSQEMCENGCEL